MLLKNGLREWNRPGRCLTLDEIARSSRFFILRLFWLEEYKGGRKFSLLKKEIKKDREEFTKFQLLFSFLTEASFLYKYKFCGEIEKLYFETIETRLHWNFYWKGSVACYLFKNLLYFYTNEFKYRSLSSYQRRKNEFAIITYTVIK